MSNKKNFFPTMRDFNASKGNRLSTVNLEACLLNYQAFKSEDLKLTTNSMIRRYPDIWKQSRLKVKKKQIKFIKSKVILKKNKEIRARSRSHILYFVRFNLIKQEKG